MNRNKRANSAFTFLSVLITVSLFKVNALVSVSGGLKTEANIHQFWLYDADDYISKTKIAPNLGSFLDIELNGKFAIRSEMVFFLEIRRKNTTTGMMISNNGE